MRVAIRVDSSAIIGSGHVMRCLTLAERLHETKDAEVHFISRDLDGNLHDQIKKAGFFLHVLPRYPLDETLGGYVAWLGVVPELDAEETKAILQEIGEVNCLVVDSYAIDKTWEREMRPFTGEIFVIDDLANREHDCDVLLDQNFYLDMANRYVGLVPENCKLLLGPRYALLREEFYEARKHLRKRDGSLRNILVFYGGSDLTNETTKAVQALVKTDLPDVTADIVVGAGNPHKAEIQSLCERYAFLRYHEQVDNMAALMVHADLMLGAGGSTTWERCFLELPSVVTAIAENQVRIAEDCAAQGWIDYIGWREEVTVERLIKELEQIKDGRIADMQRACKEMDLWNGIKKNYI